MGYPARAYRPTAPSGYAAPGLSKGAVVIAFPGAANRNIPIAGVSINQNRVLTGIIPIPEAWPKAPAAGAGGKARTPLKGFSPMAFARLAAGPIGALAIKAVADMLFPPPIGKALGPDPASKGYTLFTNCAGAPPGTIMHLWGCGVKHYIATSPGVASPRWVAGPNRWLADYSYYGGLDLPFPPLGHWFSGKQTWLSPVGQTQPAQHWTIPWIKPQTFPRVEPQPLELPMFRPMSRPVSSPMPAQAPKAVPWALIPLQRPLWRDSKTENHVRGPLPRVRPQARTRPARPRPPGPKTRERKALATGGLNGIKKLINFVTESLDALNALYKALPADLRRKLFMDSGRYMTPQDKIAALWKNYDQIDLNKAVLNLIMENLQDKWIGKFAKAGQKERGRIFDRHGFDYKGNPLGGQKIGRIITG